MSGRMFLCGLLGAILCFAIVGVPVVLKFQLDGSASALVGMLTANSGLLLGYLLGFRLEFGDRSKRRGSL